MGYLLNLVLKDILEREVSTFCWIIGKCIKNLKAYAAHYNLALIWKLQDITEAKSPEEFSSQLDNDNDPWIVIVKAKQRLISSTPIN